MNILFARRRKFLSIPVIALLSIVFWPFTLLAAIIYHSHKKIRHPAIKYPIMAVSILLLIPIGFAWAYGFVSANPELISQKSGQVAGIAEENAAPKNPVQNSETDIKESAEFVRVVDGDTIEVVLNGKTEKVRIIGIDTPEVVDPRVVPECLGKEASEKANQIFANQKVLLLERDPSQQEKDRYGRLLRYVWLNDGTTDYGRLIISLGYASEYTYDLPYKYQTTYKEEQQKAQELQVGLWKEGICAS